MHPVFQLLHPNTRLYLMKLININRSTPPQYDEDGQMLLSAKDMIIKELDIPPAAAMAFILDDGFMIQTSVDATNILHYNAHDIKGQPLIDFLTGESKRTWNIIKPYLAQHSHHCSTLQLVFRTRQTFALPSFCYLARISKQRHLMVAVGTLMPDRDSEKKLQQNIQRLKNKLRKKTLTSTPLQWPAHYHEQLQQAHAFIVGNIHLTFTMTGLEHETGLNRAKLQHGFKELYGQTVFRFITSERIKNARHYLLETDMAVKTIAGKIGYSQFQFIKVFKKITGYTPQAFRLAHKK